MLAEIALHRAPGALSKAAGTLADFLMRELSSAAPAPRVSG